MQTKYFAVLDGWRGLAVALVLIEHYFNIPNLGRLGVNLFFALSGSLMAASLWDQNIPLSRFFVRRAARVLPTFLVFVLAVYGVAFFMAPDRIDAGTLIPTLTFTRAYLPANIGIWVTRLPLGHLWSLNVEEHAYIVLAICAVITARNHKRAVIALVAVCSISLSLKAIYAFSPPSGATQVVLRSEIAGFCIFVSTLATLCRHSIERWFGRVPAIAILLACLVLSVAPTFFKIHPRYHYVTHFVVPTLLALCVVLVRVQNGIANMLLSGRVIGWLGLVSFSLYLWQQVPCTLVDQGVLNWFLPFALPGVIGFAALSYYFLEAPARRYLRDFTLARQPLIDRQGIY